MLDPATAPAPLRHPPFPVITLAAAGTACAALLLLGWLLDRGLQFRFDRALLLWVRGGVAHGVPPGPLWLTQGMLDVTALGGVTVLVIVVALVAGLLIALRHWLTLTLVLAGTISGSLVVTLVKTLVGRTRPAVTDHLVQVYDASFPSGHSANSACVYLTLALLTLQISDRRAVRRYVLAAAAVLVVAIGCSRVYLGVHWPSDVLAGWTFGSLWALAWWAFGAAIRARTAGTTPAKG